MLKVDKTVFLSYRRTNQFMALAIFKDLTARGYDVFFDYNSIKSGDFEQIILGEIEARGHFLIVLTPSALERCQEPGDWVKREIEHALRFQRNVVPLTFEGFDFGDMDKYLKGDLARLKNYNALRVPVDYFDAAMDRLSNDYLNIPIDAVLHPTAKRNEAQVEQVIQQAKSEPQPTQATMTAEEYFERAYNRDDTDSDGKIRDYSEAIRLKPDYAVAYYNRGWAYDNKGEYDRAIFDYDEAIRLKPDYATAYHNRSWTYYHKGEYNLAIADCDEAVRLKPDDADTYINRGLAYYRLGKFDLAMQDISQARLYNPDKATAYVYLNRGIAHQMKSELQQANQNYQKYVELDGVDADEIQKWIDENKRNMK